MLGRIMLFRQLVHRPSSTFTYLLASRPGGEALLIDPVAEQVELYLRLLDALELRLAFALDTHFHSDHESALEALREHTQCIAARGEGGPADSFACSVSDGEILDIDGLELTALHTPGHTEDSYSFVMDDRVFTGDTLLIRGTGRTDQGGDARVQYDSLFGKLLTLPGRTLVYPAHDYNGRHVSSIADERRLNPRLQVTSVEEYVTLMMGLTPESPSQMDVVNDSCLRPSGPLMQQLASLRAALAPADNFPASFGARTAAGVVSR